MDFCGEVQNMVVVWWFVMFYPPTTLHREQNR